MRVEKFAPASPGRVHGASGQRCRMGLRSKTAAVVGPPRALRSPRETGKALLGPAGR